MPLTTCGRGLKLVAKRAFDAKVARLAHPTKKLAAYAVKNGKVEGVPLNILIDAVLAAKNHFTHTGADFFVARG
jgi:hypothetical protein